MCRRLAPPVVRIVGHGAVELGREDDPVALAVALQRRAGDLFAPPSPVDVGRVEEVDARVDGAVDDGVGLFSRRSRAKEHGPEAQVAHLHAGSSEQSLLYAHSLSPSSLIDHSKRCAG